MIRAFSIEVPGALFSKRNDCSHKLKISESNPKLGVLNLVNWLKTTPIATKEVNTSLNNDVYQTNALAPTELSYDNLFNYHESVWFSISDLQKIFSIGQINNAAKYCSSQSVMYYHLLSQRVKQISVTEDVLLSKKNNLGNLIMEEFKPDANDKFIKESGLYIALSKIKKIKTGPAVSEFRQWIDDIVMPTIYMQTRKAVSSVKIPQTDLSLHCRKMILCDSRYQTQSDRHAEIIVIDDESEFNVEEAEKNNFTEEEVMVVEVIAPLPGEHSGVMAGMIRKK